MNTVYNWLRKLLRHTEASIVPKTLSDDYWIFDTSYDEEIASEKLLVENRSLAPETRQLARQTHAAVLETVATERATLETHTTLEAEKLRDKLGDFEGRLSLSVLIDHSGSMRGDRVPMAMMIAASVSQLALKLNLPFEVLGFTTAKWRGDPIRGLWISRGKPKSPGRLCALRHIIYSDYKTKRLPYFHAMFLPDILKENVDGEAILWAAERARRIDTKRHLIVVVSDGAPVDDSTIASNHPNFLTEHVIAVLAEMAKDETLSVIGVGLDYSVHRFYELSIRLKFFGDIEKLFLPFLTKQISDTIQD